jgi:hypothetical protein
MHAPLSSREGGSPASTNVVRRIGSCLALALSLTLPGCGGGGGDEAVADESAAAAPPAAAAGSFGVLPRNLGLATDTGARLLPFNATGPVTWASADPAVATVDGDGLVTGLAKGSTVVTATSATGATATAAVTIYRTTGPGADPTSTALIAEALAARRISDEDALLYRVLAAFGDERLPAAYVGAPDAAPDHGLLRQLASRFGGLTPARQDLLLPFLIPPMYSGSWLALQTGMAPAAAPANRARAQLLRRQAVTINCTATALPGAFVRTSTAHFNLHYFKLGASADAASAKAMALVASVIEEVWQEETAFLNRFPQADTAEACNGGDGAIDVYYAPTGFGRVGGWTSSFFSQAVADGTASACSNRPSYIVLNKASLEFMAVEQRSEAETRRAVKSILAHEFMHVLQFAMARSASCDDVEWLDEATAQWAMDHLVRTIPAGDVGEYGFEDGVDSLAPGRKKSGGDLGAYLYSEHMVSIEKAGTDPKRNGYADYLFFQYLARKQSPDTIRQIHDALAGGRNSVEAIAAVVDMKSVWPEFAKTLWNHFEDGVLDFWSTEDEYKWGLAHVFAGIGRDAPAKLRSLAVDQKGQPRATFELFKAALEFEGYRIHPRSMFFEHLKFTDATVHSAVFVNPIALFPNKEFLKIEVLKKIGGTWGEPEIWTAEPYKQFCLDRKDERLEELLVIVSNSQADRASETPFTFPALFPMRVSTSNVGCWKWKGTSTSVTTGTLPGPSDSISRGVDVVFEVSAHLPGRLIFDTTGGTVGGDSRTTLGECLATSVATSRTAVKLPIPDGTIDVNLDLDLGFGTAGGEPPNRGFLKLAGSSRLATNNTLACPTVTQTSMFDSSWDWLRVSDLTPYAVAADGRTIEGRLAESGPPGSGITIVTNWKFTALRE